MGVLRYEGYEAFPLGCAIINFVGELVKCSQLQRLL
jgi:hypothetical protein